MSNSPSLRRGVVRLVAFVALFVVLAAVLSEL